MIALVWRCHCQWRGNPMKLVYMYLKPKILIVQCHSPLIYAIACLPYPNLHKQYPRNEKGTWFVIEVIPISPKEKGVLFFSFFSDRLEWLWETKESETSATLIFSPLLDSIFFSILFTCKML